MNEKKVYIILWLLFISLLSIFITILKLKPTNTTNNELTSVNNSLKDYLINVESDNIIYMHYDKTEDNNLRYYNETPNNYILYNNELWRIIGVFNNIETDNGKKTLVKIMRNEAIGKYSYDVSSNEIYGVYNGYGNNDWNTSDLMFELNEYYYNKESSDCYTGKDGKTEVCDFTQIGLSEEAKNMIERVKWYLGSTDTSIIKSNEMYEKERETDNTWSGYVGLIYPSDYGFASEKCRFAATLNNYHVEVCNNVNYMYESVNDTTSALWTITPNYKFDNKAYAVGKSLELTNTYEARYVHPTVYLKEDVKLISGDGTIENPYTISL